ncbi:MAG: hypothetical protein COA38_18090 [Fluviicola sp.]|nr:MAG: hypothetical protein COA38_18090 [Fluviicola sp.]
MNFLFISISAQTKTTLANNPIGTKVNSEILVASTPEEFQKAINTLLNDQIKYIELQTNARSFVEHNHHWNKTTHRLVELIESTKY